MTWLAMRSAMVSISFRSSLRKGPSSDLGILRRYETSTLPTVSPCTTMLALCTHGVAGNPAAGLPDLRRGFAPGSRAGTASPAAEHRSSRGRSPPERVRLIQELIHFVQTVQFLGALLQLAKDDPDLGFVSLHFPRLARIVSACDSTTPRPERPSTRTVSLSAGRTWRTNSVSCTIGWRFSQSQSIQDGRPCRTMK